MTEEPEENGEPENGEEAEEVLVPANLKPVILGPPAHGSQDPNTAGYTLLPIQDVPEMIVVEGLPTEGLPGGQIAPQGAVVSYDKDTLLEIADEMEIPEEEANDTMTAEELTVVVLNTENLNGMTKDELADLATRLGLEGVTTSMTKGDMISAIQSGGASTPQEEPEEPEA